jgi:hypothetical protein
MVNKNTIFLWYDGAALDAARFYAETFPDSTVGTVHRAPGDYPGGKQGDVLNSCQSRSHPATFCTASACAPGCPRRFPSRLRRHKSVAAAPGDAHRVVSRGKIEFDALCQRQR